MQAFDIPVALFLFKREDKTVEIIRRIKQVKPRKLYLIADGGRTIEEHYRAQVCRELVEKEIDWECEVIKNYATQNRGVYENIGLGAKWVFEREEHAIFLEDDNLPEISFFYFCKEMLDKYKENEKILWICGSNYLEKYIPNNNADYMFTQHMLPCGWASWSDKFIKYYDGNLSLFNETNIKKIENRYHSKAFYKYDIGRFQLEFDRKLNNLKFSSWDYQMAFSLRVNDLYGIVPKYNQIRNIGVDEDSIHGGTSSFNIMTKRFCDLETFNLEFPIKSPDVIKLDKRLEKKLGDIILPPSALPTKKYLIKCLRTILFIPKDEPFLEGLNRIKSKFKK